MRICMCIPEIVARDHTVKDIFVLHGPCFEWKGNFDDKKKRALDPASLSVALFWAYTVLI
jgi:hypothetical protein